MNRFLIRLCIFLLPGIAVASLAEHLLRNIPNDYTLKVKVYKEQGRDIETLILGSSHAYYGLNPVFFSSKAFNGAHPGQTLDLDAAIFRKFGPGLTKLKCVILSISDMSLFFKLANSAEDWRMKNYSIYYQVHETSRIKDYFEVLNLPFSINRHRLISYYIRNQNAVTSSPLGYGTDYTSANKRDLNETALTVLRVHKAKNTRYFTDEKKSLEEIIRVCSKRGIKVILFTPPAYHSYSDHIDSFQITTAANTAEAFQKDYKNVFYFNFLNDTSFVADDYYDADHLNEIGAKKLSLKVNSLINRINNNF